MRIWDLPPEKLCRSHLLGEHRELHAIWNILTKGKRGYRNHPETKRWEGKLTALFNRHEELVTEMNKRGYLHKSDLDREKCIGDEIQRKFVDTKEQQIEILKRKGCSCNY
jgi:predicted RNA-binding protein (virulence factor B family)